MKVLEAIALHKKDGRMFGLDKHWLYVEDDCLYFSDVPKTIYTLSYSELMSQEWIMKEPQAPKKGEVWESCGAPVFIIDPFGIMAAFRSGFNNRDLISVSLRGEGQCPNVKRSTEEFSDTWKFLAKSLQEYYK